MTSYIFRRGDQTVSLVRTVQRDGTAFYGAPPLYSASLPTLRARGWQLIGPAPEADALALLEQARPLLTVLSNSTDLIAPAPDTARIIQREIGTLLFKIRDLIDGPEAGEGEA